MCKFIANFTYEICSRKRAEIKYNIMLLETKSTWQKKSKVEGLAPPNVKIHLKSW